MLSVHIKSWLMQPDVEVSPELLALLEKESKAWRTARLEASKIALTAQVARVDEQISLLKAG